MRIHTNERRLNRTAPSPLLVYYYTLNVIVVMHGTVSKREVRRDQLNNASQGFVTVKAWALNCWKANYNPPACTEFNFHAIVRIKSQHAWNTIFMLFWGLSDNIRVVYLYRSSPDDDRAALNLSCAFSILRLLVLPVLKSIHLAYLDNLVNAPGPSQQR